MSEFSRFSLYKRRNGVYSILYYHHGRRRWKSTNATTKPDALAALSQFRELLTVSTPSPPLAEFINRFLSYAGSTYAPKTFGIYKTVLSRFLRLTGNLFLIELTPEHFDRYKANRLQRVSPVSVNVELRALRAALSTAKRWQIVRANPFDEVTFAEVPEASPVFFTKSDFQKLLAVVSDEWLKELIVFSVATGMRQGEVLNLRWQDIDLSRKVIQVQSNATHKTKHGKRRTLPMSDLVNAMLSSKAGHSSGEFVFMRGEQMIGKSYLSHRFKAYVLKAGLEERLHWHSLRHTHASWLVQDGVSLYEVQRLLGHSSSKVTEIYSHLQPEQLHSTVNRISLN